MNPSNAKVAKMLRSAASAIEHGRISSFQKKIAEVAKSPVVAVQLDGSALATILAALRHWQDLDGESQASFDHFLDGPEPLSDEDINRLCEDLNCFDVFRITGEVQSEAIKKML